MNFKVENFYNPHLSIGALRLDSIVSVISEGEVVNELRTAIIFVVDILGSMEENGKGLQ